MIILKNSPFVFNTQFTPVHTSFSARALVSACVSFDVPLRPFLTNNFAISSKSRPFVSGTTVITNTTATAQNIEYIQNVPAVVMSCGMLFFPKEGMENQFTRNEKKSDIKLPHPSNGTS